MSNSAAIIGAPTVSDVTEDTNLQVLIAAGLISITDANAGQAAFKTTVISASGNLGTLTITSAGAYSYAVADSAVQYLGAGDTKIDTFTVTSVDGTTKKVSFTIHGVNDTAVIGTASAHDVTEDATKPVLTASGSISLSDVDQGEAVFKTSVVSAAGNLGTLTLQTNGSYSYSVNNSLVQYLGANDTKIDTFTVMSDDGTTKQISFTIHGVNDAAVIGSPTVHDVTEDNTQPLLTASGMISISDADQGQAAFKTTVTSSAGNLGTLSLQGNGSYTYSVANSATQYLGAGDTKTDTFTVTSLDGTTKQVSFTIHGINDAAVIGQPTVHDVTEDATQPILYAFGTIAISDADQGEAAFQAGILSGAGALGTLILLSNGSYGYFVSDSAIQYLGANDVKVDTFTVTALDGTTQQVSFTIHGSNDAAVIGSPAVRDVTEDSNPATLTATGNIAITDVDQGQAAFKTTMVAAAGNLGTLSLAANGSYTYSVANSATQYLGANDTKTDTFTISAVDGTTKQVTFAIHGVNDAAVIGATLVHDVTADPSKVTLTATGALSITDVDQGQAFFKTQVVSATGNLGQLTLTANGTYSYSVAESAALQLGTNGTKVDTFTVTSLDGTAKQITFTVHGPGGTVNSPAVIGDPTVHDVTEDTGATLTAAGNISITDADAGQAAFQTSVISTNGNLGSLVLGSSGSYTYSVANSATQFLGASDTKIDTFTVTSLDGTTKQIAFTIHGTNDAAVITGTSTASLTETNAVLTTGGSLSATDVDSSTAFNVQSNVAGNHGFGHFAVTAAGAWTYSADTAHNEFVGGQTYTDNFTVTTADGTAKVITVSILGTNDAAVITGTSAGSLTETNAILSTGGSLSATDVDSSAAFNVQSGVAGSNNYGHFAIAANGAWTYSTDTAHNEFAAGQTYTDSFTATTADGTQQVITVSILGTDDATVITGTSSANLTETNAILSTGGSLSATDVDSSAAFNAQSNVAGNHGFGHFAITAAGAWTYSADTAHNEFVGGQTYTDSFTATTADGTQQVITVSILGTNDTAVITGTSTASLTETNAVLSTGGLLSATDADSSAAFNVQGSVAGSNNFGHFSIAANGAWTYSTDTAHNEFAAGQTYTDSFTATTADGTQQVITVSILGTDDATVIAGTSSANLTETNAILSTGGSLSATDPDSSAAFNVLTNVAGNHGFGHFSIAANGAWTYSTDTAHNEFLAGQTYTDSFTVTTADGTSQVVTVNILGTNDAAVIGNPTVANVTEDSSVNGSGDLTASGTVTISDVDSQASFLAGATGAAGNLGSLSFAADGAYTYTVANSATQYLGPSDTKTDTFTVTAVDGTTKQVSFAIHGSQDAPTLTVGTTVTGVDNADISLNVAAGLIDTSNALAISVGNVPSGFILNHGTVSDDGSTWVLTQADLIGLALQPVGGIAKPGSFNLHIVATSADSTSVASTSTDIAVTVTANPDEFNGLALDGYIAGATVFADTNNNGILDDGEAHTTTNADGSFTLNGGSGPLVMFGGTDISTNLSFNGVLTAPEGSTVVTPLTTLIVAITTANPGVSTADAAIQVSAAFGLDPTKDLTTFDPVSAAVSGGADAAAGSAILSAGIQVQSTVAQVSAVGGSADSVFTAIASSVSASAGSSTTIDLSASSTVQDIVSNSGVSVEAATAVAAVVSAANGSIQSAGADVTALAQAAVVAQGAATTQLAGTDFSDTAQVASLQQTYVADLGTQVTNAVVGVTGLAVVGTLGADVLTGGAGNDAIDGSDGNDTINGAGGNDILYGSVGNDTLAGGDGDDRIDGGAGFDRASYEDATGGVTIDLTAGTASGAGVGSDTLVGIESIVGSNSADTFSAVGFTGSSGIAGRPIGLSEFEGKGGDDVITGTVNASGEIITRISYVSAADGVTVDIAAGTAHGTASGDVANVGNDTFTNVNIIVGSGYDDILLGSNNPNGTFEQYDGRAGNDLIDGRGGYDFAVYNNDATTTSGITVHLAAGTVTGDSTVGSDTLRSVEAVRGTNFADIYDATGFSGSSTNAGSSGTFNNFDGQGGNDTITGNGNTRIQYSNSAAAVTVDIAAGTAHGTAAGDVAQVGTDTFTGVNAVMGSVFDDTLLGSGGNENFQGLAGNDYIDGRNGFDVAQYSNLTYTTGAISVNMTSGIVTGDASSGTDTLRSIEGVQGTIFDDSYVATNFGAAGFLNTTTNNVGNNGTFNQFEGLGGNDGITGNGNTRIIYSSATDAVTINLQAGTASGGISIGNDTFVGVNSATGSNSADTYNAAGFTGVTSAGSFGTFNLFEGLGGNDTITGNGNTRIAYSSAAAGVTVDLSGATGTSHGTAGGDVANVGTDTITGGVNSVQGSNFADLIIGGAAAETFVGGGGNDTINAGGGNDNITGGAGNDTINGGAGTDVAIFSGPRSVYNITGTGTLTVTDTRTASASLTPDGTDTVSNVEVLQFSDALVLAASGSAASPVDVSNLFFPNGPLTGTAGDDYLTIGFSMFNRAIDLGAGNNTVTIGVGSGNLNLTNVQHLVGSSNDEFINLANNVNGVTVDLGGGNNDGLNLARGANSLSASNVESISGSDFGGTPSDDTLTLLNNVSIDQINLGDGTNTLNLASGTNTFGYITNVKYVNGTALDDTFTLTGNLYSTDNNPVVDLGGGNNTINIAFSYQNLTALNVQTINGNGDNNTLSLHNNVSGVSIDLGGGNDMLIVAGGSNSMSISNIEQIQSLDYDANSPSDDTLTLLNDVSGVSVNLIYGSNTLNLVAGSNSFGDLWGINLVNGSASNDTLTIQGNAANTIDLGGGTDTLILGNNGNNVTVNGIENVVGGTGFDNIVIANTTGTTTVTGGVGADSVIASAASDNIRFTKVADSAAGGGGDSVNNFDAANDAFVFDHVGGLFSGIHFVSSGVLDGTPGNPQSEAILNGNVLQIDVDGDGQIGAGDMEIYLNGLNGSLTDANFVTAGVDHRPTDIQLSAATVSENSANGTVVGALSATDSDAGDTATFSLTDDAGGRFAISGGNIVVAGGIDYEAGNSRQVTVRVTDSGGLTYDKSFNIAVTDVNETPTAVILSSQVTSTVENGGDVKVADIAITDDALGTNTLSLSGADAGAFSIQTGAGGKELHFNGGANFETKSSYDVTVNVNDASAANHIAPDASQAFHLAVTDANEAPAITSGTTATVAENAPTNTVVYQAVAGDPDATAPNNAITWSLSGADAAAFSISAGGNVTLNSSANFEVKSSYSISVVATDGGGLSDSKAVTVSITDVNEAPTAVVLSGQVTSTAENGGDVKVANIAVTDDALGTNTLSLSGADAAAFSIQTGAGGKELHFNGGANFEAKTSYDVTVNVNDASAGNHTSPDASQNFHLAITNANDAPTDISLSGNTIGQSTANGTVIGTLSAIDPDAGDTATFSLVNNAGGQFSISGNNLVVAGSLTAGAQQIVVRDTDSGGLTFDKTLTINVSTGATIVGDASDNTLGGTAGDDLIQGLDGNDTLQGLAGNDLLDGGNGQDLAVYTDATAGLTISMGAGTVTSTAADAGVGTDTLRSIELVQGSNSDDTYNAVGYWTGLGAPSANQGSLTLQGTANNTFEGMGGNDSITGNGRTTASYYHAAAGVTINLSSGATNGSAFTTGGGNAAGIGTDTLINVTFARGSESADVINGGAGNDVLIGGGGNDALNGGGGFDLANYSPSFYNTATSGISVTMSSGAVTSSDASIGNDTLRSVESVRGTGSADTFIATNFGASGFTNPSTNNVGNNGTFNEFEGMGGNDTITGNSNTRILYYNAAAGVTVDLAAGNAHGTAAGDVAQIGTDTISGIAQVRGSSFDDILSGTNTTAFTEVFEGWAGNDSIDGRGGFDVATYANNGLTTAGISANMTTGVVVGDSTIGTDTLRGIEGIQGTANNDTYVATNFGAAGFLNASTNNVGANGTFNQFEGMGGNDTITGNGNTRIIYSAATVSGVTINLQAGNASGATVGTDTFVGVNSATGSGFDDTYNAAGYDGVSAAGSFGTFNLFEGLAGNDTITGNGNTRISYSQSATSVTVNLVTGTATGTSIGTDTINSGVNSVQGSNSNDSITGGSGDEIFFAGGGADTINAGGGNDAITGQGGNDGIDGGAGSDIATFSGSIGQYTITSGASTTVQDNTANRDGTDTLTNVEFMQFSDAIVLLASGSAASPLDLTTTQLNSNTLITGTGGDDYLAVGGSIFGHQINLGLGTDTVIVTNGGATLNLVGVENVKGTSGDEFVNLVNNASGLAIDLGAGNSDHVNLAAGSNSLSLTGVEQVSATDFGPTPGVDDVLTLQNNVSGVDISLGNGNNTMNLAAGANSFVNIFDVNHVNGSSGDDTLTITGAIAAANGTTVDLGLGDDTLVLNGNFASFSAVGIEHINGSGSDNSLNLTSNVANIAINLGGGIDSVSLANGANSLSIVGVENLNASDFTGGMSPSNDVVTLQNTVSGVTVNLADGTNTLNLAAGNNSFDALWSVNLVNGSATDDTLTLLGSSANVIDLGDGNDTVNFNAGVFGVTVINAETINGSANFDTITIGNTSGSTTITAGAGADAITASAGQDNFRFASVADSTINGVSDTIVNFNADIDTFTFAGITVAGGGIEYVDTGTFAGSNQASAHIEHFGGGNDLLQIDIDGDGQMTAADMQISLTDFTGTLHNGNFLVT